MSKIRVLFIGQTPPPFGGQAVINAEVAHASYDRIEIILLRMYFSKTLAETGHFKFGKLLHFVTTLAKAVWLALIKRPRIICYPPASGESTFAFYRDVVFLFCLRTLFPFRKYVLVFHAAGISEALKKRPKRLKGLRGWFARRALFKAHLGVPVSHFGPPDCEALQTRRETIIPNGLPDIAPANVERPEHKTLQLLYMGTISEEKGIDVLLEALRTLKEKSYPFELICAGEFMSPAYKDSVESQLKAHGLTDRVRFPGVVTGPEKEALFLSSDIFCFPSHALYESFGLVVAEAMMYSIPVVATVWYGIQELVDDGETGFMVPVKRPDQVAESLEKLFADPDLRRTMGRKGREKFVKKFGVARMVRTYETMFLDV